MATFQQPPAEHVSIRPLRTDDLDQLFDRRSRSFGEEWLRRQQRSEVYVAVAEVNRTPVARMGLDFTQHTPESIAHLWSAHVEPEWQSRGIGTLLVRHLEEVACAQGFNAVRLAVGKKNARAQTLYERLGYSVIDEEIDRWSYREGGREVESVEDCWTMERQLADVAADT